MKPLGLLRSLATSSTIAFLLSTTSGQVFIPDTVERNMLNGSIPGIVDVNGVMDTLHPAIAQLDSVDAFLTVPGSALDLNAIGYLDSLRYLHISATSTQLFMPIALSISALPDDLSHLYLSMESPGSMELPELPTSLARLELAAGLVVSDASVSIEAFPDTLPYLSTNGITSFIWPEQPFVQHWDCNPGMGGSISLLSPTTVGTMTIGDYLTEVLDLSTLSVTDLVLQPTTINEGIIWPTNVERITLNVPTWTGSIAAWPLSLIELDLGWGIIQCVPAFPEGLQTLHVDNTLYCLPNWPSSLVNCYNTFFEPLEPGDVTFCSVLNSDCPGSNPGISGRVFMDTDQDGQYDNGEPPLPLSSVTLLPNGNVTGCDANGYWEMGVLPGSYTIAPSSNYPYYQSITPTQHTADVPNMGDADTLNDFAVTLMPGIEDLRAFLWAEPARPGFGNRLYLTCQNYGTVPLDASLTLEFDADQTWTGSSIAPGTLNGTTATWQLGGLPIGAQQTITVDLHTDASVPLGTPIAHTLTASPTAGDETPGDNLVVITDSVVGSYDPNDKHVRPEALPPATVQAGDTPIDYVIRFQNTGTYMAERVMIVDTLPEGLQPHTVEFLGSSHACHWYLLEGVLHFIHEGINLPDSTSNEPGSHGYVAFRVRPATDLQNGDEVVNIAHIVFDFNTPIITPPSVFRVDELVAVAEHDATVLHVMPNPARDLLRIDGFTGAGRYRIRDISGRIVAQDRLNGPGTIAIGALAAGPYVLEVDQHTVGCTVRFMKE